MTITEDAMDAKPSVLPFGKEVEVFYDGECPLCCREITMLQRWDKLRRIQFTDITRPEFHPESIGVTMERLMAEIHGRLPDGRLIVGVEVFRALYSAVGFQNLVSLTRLPLIRNVLDAGYRLFARNRLRMTGRCADRRCSIHSTHP